MTLLADRLPIRLSRPRSELTATVEPLADRLRGAVLAAILPILITSLLIAGYVGLTGRSDQLPRAVVDGAYGIAAVTALGGVVWWLDNRSRRAAFRFRVPDRVELAWTVGCLPLGVAAFLLGANFGEALGFGLPSLQYSLTDPVTLGAVVFGTIIVAPFVEEVLFRGLLLGSLLGRGYSPLVAGAATVVLFALIHVFALGVAGVLAIAGWAVFPTILRLRFENLTGAWLLHLSNNSYANVVVVALGVG